MSVLIEAPGAPGCGIRLVSFGATGIDIACVTESGEYAENPWALGEKELQLLHDHIGAWLANRSVEL